MLLGAGHFAKSFPMLLDALIPTPLWVGYHNFHSHLTYEVQRACQAIPRSQSTCVDKSVLDSSSVSFTVCLMGQWCWVHGSCWQTEKEIRIESNRGDFECYTKVPRWFFLSHGKQLTIGSGGDLNAPGWLVWVWDAGETPQCAPQMHREAGTWPGDTDLGSIWTVVSFEVLRVWMTMVPHLEKNWQ